MTNKRDEGRIFAAAKRRGLKIEVMDDGYLVRIPLFQEKLPLMYLPYRVNTVEEIEHLSDRLWKNKNYQDNIRRGFVIPEVPPKKHR